MYGLQTIKDRNETNRKRDEHIPQHQPLAGSHGCDQQAGYIYMQAEQVGQHERF